jgi:hypothetical protein
MFFCKGKDLCDGCLSPPLLCSEKGEGGLLGHFKRKYGYIRMDRMDQEDYELMRIALSDIISTGNISAVIEQQIQDKIGNSN